MATNYALDFDNPWNNAHDPQMRSASTAMGVCPVCSGVYPSEELERNEGMCLACFYASIEPDPDDTELFEDDQSADLRDPENKPAKEGE